MALNTFCRNSLAALTDSSLTAYLRGSRAGRSLFMDSKVEIAESTACSLAAAAFLPSSSAASAACSFSSSAFLEIFLETVLTAILVASLTALTASLAASLKVFSEALTLTSSAGAAASFTVTRTLAFLPPKKPKKAFLPSSKTSISAWSAVIFKDFKASATASSTVLPVFSTKAISLTPHRLFGSRLIHHILLTDLHNVHNYPIQYQASREG